MSLNAVLGNFAFIFKILRPLVGLLYLAQPIVFVLLYASNSSFLNGLLNYSKLKTSEFYLWIGNAFILGDLVLAFIVGILAVLFINKGSWGRVFRRLVVFEAAMSAIYLIGRAIVVKDVGFGSVEAFIGTRGVLVLIALSERLEG